MPKLEVLDNWQTQTKLNAEREGPRTSIGESARGRIGKGPLLVFADIFGEEIQICCNKRPEETEYIQKKKKSKKGE